MTASYHLEYRVNGTDEVSILPLNEDAPQEDVVRLMVFLKEDGDCDFVIAYAVENGVKREIYSLGAHS